MSGSTYLTGARRERLGENKPPGRIIVTLWSAADQLILLTVHEQWPIAAGRAREYEGREHLSVAPDDSPYTAGLLAWTKGFFLGRQQQCTGGSAGRAPTFTAI